ncbi:MULTISPECIES: NAD(P)H-dependent flavin oxidoreductase [Rhodanobacter]|uniref:NAD(P)H-dependent flavin oxidoreductase n=1 Tax=Rhodanobacter TaxID=75309 RepID=UPI000260FAFC|nr:MULTISPECIES: nitronate monooxygenase [Rhodanobacter]EIM02762.1 2-nitropropane dioxygenase [Rhodanobacter denitrificans]KZC21060.1 2-nitropropane dioxygenase [Rhodanobacter denitrificans]UJJ52201.1 nitronate monooxygenase [Rhodanobacter denitrificans]UJJ59019.1 nitronate monooxygenase [Rhodanobacter denitrificans]UJM89482.1 nitronate monooxygenase [Rhodanobacter denitrificans]
MDTSFASRLGIEHPLIQAPMSGSTPPALVAAVSNAGALGSLGAGYLEPQAILDQAAQIRALGEQPYAIGLFVLPDEFEADMAAVAKACEQLDALMVREGLDVRTSVPPRWAPLFSEQFAALCEARPAAAIFTFGVIAPAQLRELHRRGICVIGTATTVAEARAWAGAGADAVCMQGAEAGGHRGTFLHEAEDAMIGLFALLPLAVRAIDIPVIAAGGIMDGRGMLAAEVLGAAASQLGTAFLTCPECSAAEAWKQDLPQVEEHRVTTIRGFSGRAARGLRNRFVEAMPEAAQGLPYPVLNALTAPLRRAAAAAGRGDLLSEWCGQAAALVRPQPAAELVARLMHEYRLARRSLAH